MANLKLIRLRKRRNANQPLICTHTSICCNLIRQHPRMCYNNTVMDEWRRAFAWEAVGDLNHANPSLTEVIGNTWSGDGFSHGTLYKQTIQIFPSHYHLLHHLEYSVQYNNELQWRTHFIQRVETNTDFKTCCLPSTVAPSSHFQNKVLNAFYYVILAYNKHNSLVTSKLLRLTAFCMQWFTVNFPFSIKL